MARYFDGSDDRVVVARNAALEVPSTALTISAWIKRDGDQDNNDRICHKEYQNSTADPYVSYGLEWGGGNVVEFVVSPGTLTVLTGATALSDATWYNVIGRYSSGSAKLYINNVEDASDTPSGSITYDTTASGQMDIGGRGTDGQWMKGSIAEIGIWSAALDAGERAALAAGFSPLLVRPGSLIFYMPLIGRNDPETDVKGLTGTVTGAIASSHPRIIYPRRRQIVAPVAAAPGGYSTSLFRANAGLGALGSGPFARANAGLGAVA